MLSIWKVKLAYYVFVKVVTFFFGVWFRTVARSADKSRAPAYMYSETIRIR